MTNYEYIKTLPKDKMPEFIIDTMSGVFDTAIEESINCWRDDEARAAELDVWREWLNQEVTTE